MLLKNCIYLLTLLIGGSSFALLMWSMESKNKYTCRIIKIISIISIFYLTLLFSIQQGAVFSIDYQLGILFYEGLTILAFFLFIISIIICSLKKKKLDVDIKSKKAIVIMVVLLLTPIIYLTSIYFREKYLINNSDLILVYYSRGNGGFGDGVNFAYAVNDDYCKEISMGASISGYNMENYLPKPFVQINPKSIDDLDIEYEELEKHIKIPNTEYEIKIDDYNRDFSIYKNGKRIQLNCYTGRYFNVELEKVFIMTRN